MLPTSSPTVSSLPGGSGTGAGNTDALLLVAAAGGGCVVSLIIIGSIILLKRKLVGRKRNVTKVNVAAKKSSDNTGAGPTTYIQNVTNVTHNVMQVIPDLETGSGSELQVGSYAAATATLQPAHESELCVQENDVLKIESTEQNGWICCSTSGSSGKSAKTGWVPATCLHPLDGNPYGSDE